MKADKNFRLERSTKRFMSLMNGTKEEKSNFKNMMIAAQVHETNARISRMKGRDKDSNAE